MLGESVMLEIRCNTGIVDVTQPNIGWDAFDIVDRVVDTGNLRGAIGWIVPIIEDGICNPIEGLK